MEQIKSKATQLREVWKGALETRNENQQTNNKRLLVQVVAYGQIVFAAISLVLVVAMILYGISFTLVVIENPETALEGDFKNLGPLYRNSTGIISILWMGIVVFALDTFFQILASTRLLRATETVVTSSDGLKCIRFWWNYTVVSTIMESSPFLFSQYYYVGLLFIALRFSFLFHVRVFKKTVEKKVKAVRAAFQEAGSYMIEIDISPQ